MAEAPSLLAGLGWPRGRRAQPAGRPRLAGRLAEWQTHPACWPAWAGWEAGRVADAPSLLAGLGWLVGWLGGWTRNSDTKTSIT